MIVEHLRRPMSILSTACLLFGSFGDAWAAKTPNPAETYPTTTPIKHVVVIFGENISFDHYFATYPNAANPASEPSFFAASRALPR